MRRGRHPVRNASKASAKQPRGEAKASPKSAAAERLAAARRRRVTAAQKRRFLDTLYGHYQANKRDLPWRRTKDPYKIMVSEAMLQQTQVPRVVPKFESFVARFPTPHALASAPLSAVLAEWQGLGYNRRAKNLWHAAQHLVERFGGQVPRTYEELRTLPGVGDYTAGAILAFAFRVGRPIIETNVRAVMIHHFCRGRAEVTEEEILWITERTLEGENPRDYYAAIMDYGTHLKATVGNVSRRSLHHGKVKKAPFQGSARQVRGATLRALVAGALTPDALARRVTEEIRVPAVAVRASIVTLLKDGMIVKAGRKLTLP